MKPVRVGFVGVGEWARKIREVFPEAFPGELVTAAGYVRKGNRVPAAWFGERFSTWEELVCHPWIDLVIAAADPQTNALVARWRAENCKAVIASKPLLWHPAIVGAPFYVDFWRLWSPPYMAFREHVQRRLVELEINFFGCGPYRETMSGLYDYGPHAFAFASELLGDDLTGLEIIRTAVKCERGELHTFAFESAGRKVTITTGNGAVTQVRQIIARTRGGEVNYLTEKGSFIECRLDSITSGQQILRCSKQLAIKRFLSDVIEDVRSGHWDMNPTVDYSEAAMHVLTNA